jgi:hypothetical protein
MVVFYFASVADAANGKYTVIIVLISSNESVVILLCPSTNRHNFLQLRCTRARFGDGGLLCCSCGCSIIQGAALMLKVALACTMLNASTNICGCIIAAPIGTNCDVPGTTFG